MQFIIPVMIASLSLSACKNSSQDAIKEKHKEEMQNKENRVSPLATATANIDGNTVTINYSSPKVKGRQIWGSLVPYGEVWRTGANEATTISFSKGVMIEGQPLTNDIYSLFTIPGPDEWTVIFNLNETQWGAFKYDTSEDALRVQVKPTPVETSTEDLTFSIIPDSIPNAGIVRLNWEKLQVDFHFLNAEGGEK